MAEHGAGCVVNITSVNSVRPEPSAALYCASKVALDMLTQVAALEHAATGVRVNAVRPGYVLTPLHDTVLESAGGPTPENVAAVEASVPMRRRAEPEEVGEAVAWLCSSDSRYVTGTTLTVDGGIAIAFD
jgi:NAD(P)-dependent dehydrogenase (short-subunit alcohol dehydrogenase family)